MEARACRGPEAGRARGPVGAGAEAPAQQAPQEGPRPFLSVLPTAQSSCACAKGKLRLKNKNPEGGTSPAALDGCGAPPPPQGNLGGQPGCWEARRVTALQPPRGLWAALLPWVAGQTSWDPAGGGGRKTASGSLCPHAPDLGGWTRGGKSMEAPLYSPSFCEKIFSKVTSPRSSRYFCMTLRMLKDRGDMVTRGSRGTCQASWSCPPLESHCLLSQDPEWGALLVGVPAPSRKEAAHWT